jgi:hypothetical protein
MACLVALGDGNWNMGEGVGKGGKAIGNTQAEVEFFILGHYLREAPLRHCEPCRSLLPQTMS